MEANERTFRHSFGKLALMFLGAVFLGFLAFLAFSVGETNYFLFGIAGIVLIIALFYATSSVKVSNEEITINRLLGSKSLRWPEIARVSTRGQGLRLHNYDGDLALSIDPQLEGYAEILDAIFHKRPDLFDNNDNTVMSGSWLVSLLALGSGLLFIAASVFWFFGAEESEKVFPLILFGIGVFVIAIWFFAPKRLTLESKALMIGYFFKEESYSAGDIDSISLEKQRTRNGYIYFVRINLRSGKKIKLPTFNQGVPLTYQILKRWHEKAIRAA